MKPLSDRRKRKTVPRSQTEVHLGGDVPEVRTPLLVSLDSDRGTQGHTIWEDEEDDEILGDLVSV